MKMSSHFFRFALTLAIGIVSVLGVLFYSGVTTSGMAFEVDACRGLGRAELFSCYRSVLGRHFDGDLLIYLQDIQSAELTFKDDATKGEPYGIFGTACHTFYHALGDFVASETPHLGVKEQLELGSSTCSAGYAMGLMKRRAYLSGYATTTLRSDLTEFFRWCYPESKEWCAHEVGHILYDAAEEPILRVVDQISSDRYDTPTQEYPGVVSNLRTPFEECRTILPKEWWGECYIGIGHNAFLFEEFVPDGYRQGTSICTNIAKQSDMTACISSVLYRIGIHYGTPDFLSGRFAEALAVCSRASGNSDVAQSDLSPCFVGIGRGIGTYILSTVLTSRSVVREAPVSQKEPHELFKLCLSAPPELRGACYDGMVSKEEFVTAYRAFAWQDREIDEALARKGREAQL